MGGGFRARCAGQWARKPQQNGYVESFNGKLRDECLNVNWFENLWDARRKIAAWQKEYNEERPHRSLGYQTPAAFARQLSPSPGSAPNCGAPPPFTGGECRMIQPAQTGGRSDGDGSLSARSDEFWWSWQCDSLFFRRELRRLPSPGDLGVVRSRSAKLARGLVKGAAHRPKS